MSSHTNSVPVHHPLAFTIATLPSSSSGYLRDAKGVSIVTTPYVLNDSYVWFNSVPCCTAITCTQAQIQQQQQVHNQTSFSYLSSDLNSKGPLSVSLAVMCPTITVTANTFTDVVGIKIAIALAVIIFVAGIAYGIKQVNIISHIFSVRPNTPSYPHNIHLRCPMPSFGSILFDARKWNN